MKSRSLATGLILAVLLMVGGAAGRAEEGAAKGCGDEALACRDEEKCCEHVVAYFTADGATAPPYVEGQCLPKSQRCGDFWCGTKHCQAGLFGTPAVCCVNNDSASVPSYQCAFSELSCPGNSSHLTIRPQELASASLRND